MANEADLKLIQIPEFPKTDTLVGSGPEYVVLTKADGVTYGMLTEDFKAFLGTVQVQVPKALAPTDPAPTLSGVYYPTVTQNETGTPIVYANAGGIEVNTAEGGADHNSMVQLIYDGSSWVKVNVPIDVPVPDLSNLVEKTDIVDNLDTDDAEKPLSASVGVAIKPRILPENNTAEDYDRPDLATVFVDKDNKVIQKIYAGELGDAMNKLMAVNIEIDRPDLKGKLIILDKDNKVVAILGENSGSNPDPTPIVEFKQFMRVWNPPTQPAYNAIDIPYLMDYDLLIGEWEALAEAHPTNPETEPYITKSIFGESSTQGYDLVEYRFKSPDAKYSLMLIGGTHGHEKNYIKGLLDFMRLVLENWTSDPFLEWWRWNVDLTIIPCLMPTSMSYPERPLGHRCTREIEDFPVSWTKVGNEVTITYDNADFPAGRFNPDTYFAGAGLAGKLGITITQSSDPAAISNYAHKIKSVINGKTIVVETADTGGASSGTAVLGIWVDPNRNWGNYEQPNWVDFNPSPTAILNVGDHYFHYENKGTRPISMLENQGLEALIEEREPQFVIDLHMPADDNYLGWRSNPSIGDTTEFVANLKKYQGQFSMYNFNRVTWSGVMDARATVYFAQQLQPYFVLEWGGSIENVTSEMATDSMRWMVISANELIKHFNK